MIMHVCIITWQSLMYLQKYKHACCREKAHKEHIAIIAMLVIIRLAEKQNATTHA